jgi:hypothetical protein
MPNVQPQTKKSIPSTNPPNKRKAKTQGNEVNANKSNPKPQPQPQPQPQPHPSRKRHKLRIPRHAITPHPSLAKPLLHKQPPRLIEPNILPLHDAQHLLLPRVVQALPRIALHKIACQVEVRGVQAGLDVFAEGGGQARVEGSGGDAWEEVEPAGAGEVECCGWRVLVSCGYIWRGGMWGWIGLDGTGVWVRTCADGEDEEGDGVEHVGHGGGLREAARGVWMSLRRSGGCVRRGGGLRECVCWLRRGGWSGRAWYRVGNKGQNRNVRRDREVASTRLQSQCVSATRLHRHGRGGSKLFATVAADDAVRTRSVTVVSALARLTLRPRRPRPRAPPQISH